MNGGFHVEMGDVKLSLSFSSNGCGTFAGSIKTPGSPWRVFGDMAMGTGCALPMDSFSFQGKLGVGFGWEVKWEVGVKIGMWKETVEATCGLEINAYFGGRMSDRLGKWNHCTGGRRAEGIDSASEGEDEEELDDEDLEEEDSGVDDKSLSVATKKERRLNHITRSCYLTGFELLAGAGVTGSCGVSRRRIGVSLSGNFDASIGPWPAPLDARARGTITASVCLNLLVFDVCLNMSPKEVMNWDIPNAFVPHSCSECYQPTGESQCVDMFDQSDSCKSASVCRVCDGCVANPNSWHCPGGSCTGNICQNR
jgi:hypothetical protein